MLLPLNWLVLSSLVDGSFLRWNLTRDTSQYNNEQLIKRDNDGSYTLTAIEQHNFYSVEVELGTPPQKLQLLLDTGSSDMIVVSNSNPYCTSTTDCDTYGSFDSTTSSSFVPKGKNFKMKYADGTSSTGEWGSDIVSLSNGNGDMEEMDLTFGLATDSDSMGVLGIGLSGLEVSRGSTSGSFSYNNFPMQLRSVGVIDTILYSMSLNKDKTTGDILFGAVDTSKYQPGQLFVLPMINRFKSQGYSNPIKIEVTLQGLGKIGDDNSQYTYTTSKLPALIDSGSTVVYLPNQLATQILNEVGAMSHGDHYRVSCSLAQDNSMQTKRLVFDFGGFHISIPWSNFVLTNSVDSNGQCTFGILGQTENAVTLGDSFLSSVYVVFDLENYEVSMAQRFEDGDNNNSDPGSTSLEVVNKGNIPGIRKATGYDDIWTSDEGVTLGGNIFTINDAVVSSTGDIDLYPPLSSTSPVTSLQTPSTSSVPTTSTIVKPSSSKPASRPATSKFSSTERSSTSYTSIGYPTSKRSSTKKSSTKGITMTTINAHHSSTRSIKSNNNNSTVSISKSTSQSKKKKSSTSSTPIKTENRSTMLRMNTSSVTISSSTVATTTSTSSSQDKKTNIGVPQWNSNIVNILVIYMGFLLGYLF